MLFELSFVRKYLSPRRKQISVSLITLVSVFVVALVVWLLLLFLSITDGIEKGWLKRLTALNAPLRIQPTEHYFSSYFYKADLFSHSSQFSYKTIGQKAASPRSDPFDPTCDPALPSFLPPPERDASGELIDPVKRAYAVLRQLDLSFQDYELSGALMRLRLLRPHGVDEIETQLTQVSYLASLTDQSPTLHQLFLPPSQEDLQQLSYLSLRSQEIRSALAAHSKQFALLTNFKENPTISPVWTYQVNSQPRLPTLAHLGTGVLLAKSLQDSGVRIGDSGFLSYGASTASALQEQRIPIFVAGFYDPGLISVGNRCILVPSSITQTIQSAQGPYAMDPTQSSGLMVWLGDLSQAQTVKAKIERQFADQGIASYWKVTTFHEYEFAKDLLQQFQSDRLLFTLVGALILIVACCNILSLLILLVNQKKREIAILQAMGASRKSIALIFGLAGAAIGLAGAFLGTGLAWITLKKIDRVVQLLSDLQGHATFNPLFYGSSLPSQLSADALSFVLLTTPIIALIAGLIPALKACRLHPSEVLKSP